MSIQESGLVPYVLPWHIRQKIPIDILEKKPDLGGIFVWTRELTPLEHAGSLFYQAHKKRTNYIAVLSVEYEEEDQKIDGKRIFELTHTMPAMPDGYGAEEPFWHIDVPATLLFRVIPKERVKLLDLVDLSWRLRLEKPDKYADYSAGWPKRKA